MRALAHIRAPVLAAALVGAGLSSAFATDSAQQSRPGKDHVPASSRCMIECNKMEVRCEELEMEFPACGTGDICLEEKEQCQAKCLATAMLYPAFPGTRYSRC